MYFLKSINKTNKEKTTDACIAQSLKYAIIPSINISAVINIIAFLFCKKQIIRSLTDLC